MTRKITTELISKFKNFLIEEEKSSHTIEKYIRDIRAFQSWLETRELNKSIVINYKKHLTESFAASSVNSIISSINSFLHLMNGTI